MKNLLITTVGPYNHFLNWTDGRQEFDVRVWDYAYNPGFKYPLIFQMLITEPNDYDYFFMPDEDINMTSRDINRLFAAMRDNDLDLAQPSIERSEESHPSWEAFVHREGDGDIIPTDFVEIMCPCFSRKALERCLETFPKSQSGWGLDIVWPTLLQGNKIAIINSVIAQHTRKVKGGCLYDALRKKGISPSTEKKRLMKEYGITVMPHATQYK